MRYAERSLRAEVDPDVEFIALLVSMASLALTFVQTSLQIQEMHRESRPRLGTNALRLVETLARTTRALNTNLRHVRDVLTRDSHAAELLFNASLRIGSVSLTLSFDDHRQYSAGLRDALTAAAAFSYDANAVIRDAPEAAAALGHFMHQDLGEIVKQINEALGADKGTGRALIDECLRTLDALETATSQFVTTDA